MKYSFTIIILLFGLSSFSQGLIIDEEAYESIPVYKSNSLGFANTNTSIEKKSLKKYCPPIGNQGKYGTCVGWAIAYAAMSIKHNVKENITDITKKKLFAFDPLFIYTILKEENDDACSEGLITKDAVKALKKYGCKRLVIGDETGCVNKSSLTEKMKKQAELYKIKDELEKIPVSENQIAQIKQVLNENNPLIISVKYLASGGIWNETKEIGKNGLWKFRTYHKEEDGTHAMCIIGYNDKKYGGAFQIMNSWGKDFGQDGFLWIKYQDFPKVVKEVFLFKINVNSTYYTKKGNCLLGDCNEGYGQMKANNGEFYEGEFQKGKKHGSGILIDNDGKGWIGNWSKDKRNGVFICHDKVNGNTFQKCGTNINKNNAVFYSGGVACQIIDKDEFKTASKESDLGFAGTNNNELINLLKRLESYGILEDK